MYLYTTMLRLIALYVFITSILAFPSWNKERVVNGTDANLGEFPYIISLRSSKSHTCGGSILDEHHVLTAAHCVVSRRPEQLTVQYGVIEISANENVIQVSKTTIHEQYNPSMNYANDVAVLKLARPIPFSKSVRPVVLPEQNEAPPAGAVGVLAGWGLDGKGSLMKHLQRVDLLVYSDEDCSKAHGANVNKKYHLCSGVPEGGKGQCNGDSGGPLTANGKIIGSVSWSVKPCTIRGYPGVYSRTSSYVNWIKDKMQV